MVMKFVRKVIFFCFLNKDEIQFWNANSLFFFVLPIDIRNWKTEKLTEYCLMLICCIQKSICDFFQVEINTRSMEKILWNSLIELWKSFGPKKKKFVEFEFKNEKTFFSICLITGTGWVRLVLCIYTISQEFIFYSMCSK